MSVEQGKAGIREYFDKYPHRESREATIMLLAIGLQESRFTHRRQTNNGPAKGFWQFEKGSRLSRGGVWGVYLHSASTRELAELCKWRQCLFDPVTIWNRIEHDDTLAAGVARLLLLTDPKPLPVEHDVEGAWMLYAKRTWRPGKPHRETWNTFHAQAVIWADDLAAS